MPLLDFPPEAFENVVHELVSVVGINRAWKLRAVCRTFQSVITHDVFAMQTVETFRRTAQRIFHNNSGLYLYYRSKKLLDAHLYLPDTVNHMVNYMAKELDVDSDKGKETLRQGLCDSLHMFCSSYLTLSALTDGLEGTRSNTVTSALPSFGSFEKLVAALCLGHHFLVPALIQELPTLDIHPIFGAPLRRATDLDDEAAVRGILDGISVALANKDKTTSVRDAFQMAKPLSWALCPKRGFVIGDAVYTAISRGHEKLLNLLVNWYTDQGLTFFKDAYNHFLETAIDNSRLAIVRIVLEIPYVKHGSAKKVTWAHYQNACARGREDVVKLFLDNGYIDANDKVLATSPLFEAVLSDRLAVVKTLIEAGADVNQEPVWRHKKLLPIMIAIRKQNFAIIQYLLDMGSNLPQVSTWPREWKFVRIYEVL